jgi:hypothetical protein
MSKRQKVIVALLLLAAVVAVSESGFYSLKSAGGGGCGMGITYLDIDMESITGYSVTETSSGYRLLIYEDNAEQHAADVVIEIDSLEIGGRLWTPLHKTATASYSGKALFIPDLIEISYSGDMEDITIVGLCSPHAARRAVRQMVVDEIRRTLETAAWDQGPRKIRSVVPFPFILWHLALPSCLPP